MVEGERKGFLNRLVSVGDVFGYTYDFGDNWNHQITVELVSFDQDDMNGGAYVLAGDGACPSEDVGGIPWYLAMLDTLLNQPDSEEAKHLINWVGDDFNSCYFEKRSANAAIVRMMFNHWGGK